MAYKHRFTVYVDPELHKKLKATLAMREETVSGWFEYQAKRLVDAVAMFKGSYDADSDLNR